MASSEVSQPIQWEVSQPVGRHNRVDNPPPIIYTTYSILSVHSYVTHDMCVFQKNLAGVRWKSFSLEDKLILKRLVSKMDFDLQLLFKR